jgi:hypothetical protein
MTQYLGVVLLLAGGLLLAAPSRAVAQDRLEDDPGYVDFSLIEGWFGTEATIEVNIRGALLRLVAGASEHEDPELASMLRRLKAIQVRGFSLRRSSYRDAEDHMSDMADRLEARGWDTVVRVREPDERVDMYIKTRGDAIAGLMVLVVDAADDESVFINIVGEIDPEEIGRIGRTFDIGPLDRM